MAKKTLADYLRKDHACIDMELKKNFGRGKTERMEGWTADRLLVKRG